MCWKFHIIWLALNWCLFEAQSSQKHPIGRGVHINSTKGRHCHPCCGYQVLRGLGLGHIGQIWHDQGSGVGSFWAWGSSCHCRQSLNPSSHHNRTAWVASGVTWGCFVWEWVLGVISWELVDKPGETCEIKLIIPGENKINYSGGWSSPTVVFRVNSKAWPFAFAQLSGCAL